VKAITCSFGDRALRRVEADLVSVVMMFPFVVLSHHNGTSMRPVHGVRLWLRMGAMPGGVSPGCTERLGHRSLL
jgi:hypothetical protein